MCGNLQEQIAVLLLAAPLPGLDGKPVPLEKAKPVVGAVLAGVHSLWQKYENLLRLPSDTTPTQAREGESTFVEEPSPSPPDVAGDDAPRRS